jgi:hypothetical protein
VPFLLGIEHRSDGLTHLQYDDGPTRRVNVLTFTAMASVTLDVPADQLLSPTLSTVRPPDRRRSRL